MVLFGRNRLSMLAWGFLILPLVGCGGGATLHPVEGTVTVKGAPLKAGSVSFWPEDEKNTARPTGVVKDGAFTVMTKGDAGAPAGKYKVTVTSMAGGGDSDPTAPPPKGLDKMARPFDVQYEEVAKTPLVVEVKAGAKKSDFELKLTK